MGRWTNRQFQVVQAWLEEQWNRPDRADHYLMELIAETRRSWVDKPRQVTTAGMGLPLEFKRVAPRTPARAITREAATAAAKARWFGVMGMPVREVKGAG